MRFVRCRRLDGFTCISDGFATDPGLSGSAVYSYSTSIPLVSSLVPRLLVHFTGIEARSYM